MGERRRGKEGKEEEGRGTEQGRRNEEKET